MNNVREMTLFGYLMAGPTWHLYGAWRHPDSDALDSLDPRRYETIAQICEAGKFDGVFFVDFVTIFDTYGGDLQTCMREPGQMCMLEPMQLLAGMARVTSRIGLAASMSTSLYPPYHIARSFATLDHISQGRAGWNIVTSAMQSEAQNYGFDKLLEKSQRYDHADEVLEACDALWESWDADALVLSREDNVYVDGSKVRYANYQGSRVSTRGPLTAPRSPQTRPVMMQAGSSPRGRQFAGRWAEAIFTVQSNERDMRAYYRDIKRHVVDAGRAATQCRVLPAIDVVIGTTQAQAEEKAAEINRYASPSLGVQELSNVVGIDLAPYPLDTPIADLDLGHIYQGIVDSIRQGSGRDNLTLGEAGEAWSRNQMCPQFVGTSESVANKLQHLFENECCDGFMLCPSLSPGGYQDFVDGVVPILQHRKLFRTEYAASTFRDNLLT
jgi:FMN-dependent oxidoreductase (nitrilotriacetate monooxygenase family)